MAHLTCKDLEHHAEIPEETDVVVVGAGMAGLYVTWRLLREDPDRHICILEKIDRTGGRLNSDVIEFDDGDQVKEEEGGMRFTFDIMDDLMSLFLILEIDDKIVPFPMNSAGNNRLYFRGRAFSNKTAAEDDYGVWSKLYDLAPAERGIDPKSIIVTVFNRILAANPEFKDRPDIRTPGFWQDFRLECEWNGVKLKDWSLWNLLSEMGLSNECITLLYRLLGFNGTFLSDMNAGEAYQLLEDFPAEPDFKTLRDGFSTLPNALVHEIGREHIYLQTLVENIDKIGDEDAYTLTYSTVDEEGQTLEGYIKANKVVLALPRLALEKLFLRSNALNSLGDKSQQLWNTLQTTTNQPLLKINLYYDKAWWGNNLTGQPPIAFGPNFSDLPLGSVYPFYAIDEELFAALEYEKWLAARNRGIPSRLKGKLADIKNGKYDKPAALTIYCDYLNVNYWKALQQNGPLFCSPKQKELNEMEPQTLYAASQAVVREATRFFKQLFNTHYVPEPVLTSARIWSGTTRFGVEPAEQVGFGVHQWALHADDRETMAYLIEPLEGLYTCGEAYSDYQGWVEGALRSADLVLHKAFHLKPISDVYLDEQGKCPSDAIKTRYAERAAQQIRDYIDPNFDSDAAAADVSDAEPEEAVRYRVALTYFDRP